MIYIPKKWFKDLKNKDKVYEIIDKANADLVFDGKEFTMEDAFEEINALGETEIVENLKNSF